MDFCFECAELLRGKFRRPGNRGYGLSIWSLVLGKLDHVITLHTAAIATGITIMPDNSLLLCGVS
jgi:hypothetical protein